VSKRKLLSFLLSVCLLLSACGSGPTKIAPLEVTRLVRESQVVTAEVTRIVQETQLATLEVTRLVRETVVVTATPTPQLTVAVNQGTALLVPRSLHNATSLLDGRILIAGGSRVPDVQLSKAEIYDPASGQLSQAASLHTARHGHSATLLPDGRVLVVGGYNLPRQWLNDAEVYDPAADTWMVVPPLYSHGVSHTATLLKDGRVLVVGGCIGSGICTDRVEIFDPQTDSWAEAMSLPGDRASQTAQLLEDGRVLVVGGWGAAGAPAGGDALLYDPQTDTWSPTGEMVTPCIFGQSARLPDGHVLVAGGAIPADGATPHATASVEIYDPASNTWAAATPLLQPRYAFVLALLPQGQVLAVGGVNTYENNWTESSLVQEIESYDPLANRWRVVDEFPQPAAFAAGALLPDGRLWVTGGQAASPRSPSLSNTWLITAVFNQ
jgi:N-acetylneuraminic acid mutarotase